MDTCAMDLRAWGVTALGASAEAVRGGDPIDMLIGALIAYGIANYGSFIQGLEDGFDMGTHN
ncbi:MAG TPA: hypothetical protein VFQ38_05720 [Longimicrobiales bacterium]|nr:hypothetical protein [Longimicrobiales bacterium]